MQNQLKIINDPIYGFITIPTPFIFELIEHPYVQRLRRITQMGLSYLVYPGAHHTRFHHALGALFLMQKAVNVLRFKGVEISNEEAEALYIAILLHDVGHGPFSHALEFCLAADTTHEAISLKFMEALNIQFNGKLSLAITMFKNQYPRTFFNQLISSQLDVDRLDYLRRDSFYTGVAEGTISSERLISMLHVVDDKLVVEEKGIYSVEKFIVARRLMYWQVYLHKTSVAAEKMLVTLFERLRTISKIAPVLPVNNQLQTFLNKPTNPNSKAWLDAYAKLDDTDIMHAIKQMETHPDFVLRTLSQMLLNRDLLKIKIQDAPFPPKKINDKRFAVQNTFSISEADASCLVLTGSIANQAYQNLTNPIQLLTKKGKLIDVAKASDQLNLQALTQKVTKYYFCYPKLLS